MKCKQPVIWLWWSRKSAWGATGRMVAWEWECNFKSSSIASSWSYFLSCTSVHCHTSSTIYNQLLLLLPYLLLFKLCTSVSCCCFCVLRFYLSVYLCLCLCYVVLCTTGKWNGNENLNWYLIQYTQTDKQTGKQTVIQRDKRFDIGRKMLHSDVNLLKNLQNFLLFILSETKSCKSFHWKVPRCKVSPQSPIYEWRLKIPCKTKNSLRVSGKPF